MVTTRTRNVKSRTPAGPRATAAKKGAAAKAGAPESRPAALRKGASAPARKTKPAAAPADLVVAAAQPDSQAQAAAPVAPRAGAKVAPDAAEADAPMKKKQLVERVIALSGAKKRDAKDIVEATLAALGQALAEGRSINLPPLGKLTVNRQKDLGSGEVLIVKLRRKGADETDAANPLAETVVEG